jgi:short-subunit dehydrogenase
LKLQQELQALPAGSVHTVPAKIIVANNRNKIVAESQRAPGGIDILINAANVNPIGVFATLDAAMIQGMIETNTIAPMLLARAVLA